MISVGNETMLVLFTDDCEIYGIKIFQVQYF